MCVLFLLWRVAVDGLIAKILLGFIAFLEHARIIKAVVDLSYWNRIFAHLVEFVSSFGEMFVEFGLRVFLLLWSLLLSVGVNVHLFFLLLSVLKLFELVQF